jgi:hypothetical protein
MLHVFKRIAVTSVLTASLLGPAAAVNAESAPVTRGDFIRIIADQLHLAPGKETPLPKDVLPDSPYADAAKAMIERKAVEGYDDGTFRLDRPITGTEASYVLARILGMNEESALKELQNRYQISFGEDAALTADTVKQLVQTALKSDDGALAWLKESAEQQKAVTSFRADMTLDMNMRMRAMQEQTVGSKMTSRIEFQKDQGIHQRAVTEVQAPEGPVQITMDQYTVTQGTYMQMTDPATGKAVWYDMTALTPFTFQQLIELQKSNAGAAQWVLPTFFYRDLGTNAADGQKLHKIEVNGSVADLQELTGILGQAAGVTNMDKVWKEIPGMKGMRIGMSGTFWFDETSRQLVRMDASYMIRFGNESASDVPLQEMEMTMKALYKDYNAAIEIKLPEEARKAVPLTLPDAVPPQT